MILVLGLCIESGAYHGAVTAETTTTLPMQECFVSLQGEGLLAGVPSSFLRVAGCNLRCVWCDSPATSWAPKPTMAPITELVDFCAAGPRHVVLTGGEPMMFRAIVELASKLADAGHHVTVETAGTVQRDGLRCDLMSVSPKLSHSTPWERDEAWARKHESLRIQPDVLRSLMDAYPWQLKLVVRAEREDTLAADVEEVEALLAMLDIPSEERERVLLMPQCTERGRLHASYVNLVDVCTRLGVRLGERLHITLFGNTPGT